MSGFSLNLDSTNTAGYDINYGAITKSGASFNITDSGNAANILKLNFRWVATVGEHLQLFPISYTSTINVFNYAFTVPFNYGGSVVWSPGNFDVGVTAIVSSFSIVQHLSYYSAMLYVAKWDGQRYSYNGNTGLVLDVNALYGTNCPFTTDNSGASILNLFASVVVGGSKITMFLLLHKVQQPGTDPLVTTGFGVLRDYTQYETFGTHTYDISNSIYNLNGVDPAAIRVFGIESFRFYGSSSPTSVQIGTTDGVNAEVTKTQYSYTYQFIGNYKAIPPCPYGCTCTSNVCAACISNTFRVANPVVVDGTAKCPCFKGFYQNADKVCVPCPKTLNCDSCSLVGNAPTCTACKCSQHRELSNSDTCICKTGFTEDTPPGAYCVRS